MLPNCCICATLELQSILTFLQNSSSKCILVPPIAAEATTGDAYFRASKCFLGVLYMLALSVLKLKTVQKQRRSW